MTAEEVEFAVNHKAEREEWDQESGEETHTDNVSLPSQSSTDIVPRDANECWNLVPVRVPPPVPCVSTPKKCAKEIDGLESMKAKKELASTPRVRVPPPVPPLSNSFLRSSPLVALSSNSLKRSRPSSMQAEIDAGGEGTRVRLRTVHDSIRRAEQAARRASQMASSTALALSTEADALGAAVDVLEVILNDPRMWS